MSTCSKCKSPAITYIRYSGSHLCSTHFLEFVETRVKKDLKKQGKTIGPRTIAVALSGGKDSTVALYLAWKVYGRRRDVTLHAITVDEGIRGYRDDSIPVARRTCTSLGVEHHVVSFQEAIGTTMDEIAQRHDELGECSYCGVFRRRCLNMVARQLHADRLVTGHNLDDMAQSILMNFSNATLEKLARLGPHTKVQPGLIPRTLPLRTIPEKEVMLYAMLSHLTFHNAECPYATRASRGVYRDLLATLEDATPGTRHGILRSYDGIKELLQQMYPQAPLGRCDRCQEPTSQQTCKTCVLQKRLGLR